MEGSESTSSVLMEKTDLDSEAGHRNASYRTQICSLIVSTKDVSSAQTYRVTVDQNANSLNTSVANSSDFSIYFSTLLSLVSYFAENRVALPE